VTHLRERSPDVQLTVVSATADFDIQLQPCERVLDFEAGLGLQPDAVVIASVSSRHADELLACLARGLPCLAEKPLVTSRIQLARIREVAAQGVCAGVVMGCNLRYLPVLQRLRAELRNGRIGRIVRAQLEVGQHLTQWRPGRALHSSYSANSAQGGGVVFDLVHEIDMARWLLGELQVRSAAGGRLSGLPIAADDVHVALLRDAHGAPVVVSLDYVSRRAVRRYAIVGQEGTLECDLMARQMTLSTAEKSIVLAEDGADFDVAATYGAQMADWLAAWRDPSHPVTSPLDDAMATAELMLAMKEAQA
jgi:predicted dehydrogenase